MNAERWIDTARPSEESAWRPVHDGVMGGRSSGTASRSDVGVRFEGTVSLENNGGFASFRRDVAPTTIDDPAALLLRVRGDGQVYKVSLSSSGRWDAVSWQAPFATRMDQWTTIRLPFDRFVPTWRGRVVPDAGRLDVSRVGELGVLIADKQSGPFAIELEAVDVLGDDAPAPTATLQELARAGRPGEQLLEAARWNDRLLVVSTPGQDLDPDASKLLGRLYSRGDDLDERAIRVVQLFDSSSGRLAGATVGPSQVRALRARLELPARAWGVALVGLDGGVKRRWSRPFESDELFATIDAMPMRRREMGSDD